MLRHYGTIQSSYRILGGLILAIYKAQFGLAEEVIATCVFAGHIFEIVHSVNPFDSKI